MGNDRDHRGADSIERTSHPWQPAESQIRSRQREDHHERRSNERGTNHCRANKTRAHPPQIDRELRGQRTRGELRERESLFVLPWRKPTPPLLEVASHTFDENHRPAEADCSQPEEVSEQATQRRGRVRG